MFLRNTTIGGMLIMAVIIAASLKMAEAGCGTSPSGVSLANCDICPKSGGLDCQVNDMKGVPRVNTQAKAISRNLGSYNIYTCPGPGNTDCGFASVDFMKVLNGDSDDPDSVNVYISGLFMHAAFAVACIIVTLLFGIFLGIGRYCCCCCGKKRCIGGCCASRFPTQKPPATASCWKRWCTFGGMVPTEAGLAGLPDSPRWAYSFWDRVCNLAFFVGFVFCVFLFVGLSFFSGIRQLPTSMATVINDSPGAMMSLISDTRGPLGNLLGGLASQSVVGLMVDVNSTFNSVAPIKDVLAQADCVLDGVTNLPSVQPLIDFVDISKGRLNNLVDTVAGLVPTLDTTIEGMKDDIREKTDVQLIAPMRTVELSINTTRLHLIAFRTQLVTLQDDVDVVTSNDIPDIQSDFAALNNLPSSADVTALTVAPGSSLTTLYDTSKDENSQASMDGTQRTTLISKLGNMGTTLGGLPNYRTTAINVRALDDQITYWQQVQLRSIYDSVAQTTSDLDELQSTVTTLSTAVDVFLGNLSNIIDLTPGYDLINQLNRTLYDDSLLPDFDDLNHRVDNLIDPLQKDVLPCLDTLFGYVHRINDTLLGLPDSMRSAEEVLDDVNATIADARQSVQDLIANIGDYDSQRAKLNISQFRTMIESIKTTVLDNDLADSASFNLIDSALNTTMDVNLTSLTTGITQLNNSLTASRVQNLDTFISTLNTFEDNKASILINLGTVKADTTKFDQGYCNEDPTKFCYGAGDCTTGCNMAQAGVRRCAETPLVACPTDADNPDADCVGSANDYCLINPDRIDTLIAELVALQLATSTLQSETSDVSNELQDTSDAMTDHDTVAEQQELTDAITALDDADVSSFYTVIDDLIDSVEYDTSTLMDQVHDFNDTIQTIDYQQGIDQILEINQTLYDVQTDKLDMLRDNRKVLYTFEQFLDVKIPDYAIRLSPAALASIKQTDGVSGILQVIGNIVDEAIQFLNENQDLVSVDSVDALNKTQKIRDGMDILFAEGGLGIETASEGTIFQVVRLMALLADKSDYLLPTDADWPLRDRLDVNALGEDYMDGKKCVTKDCIKKEITVRFGSTSGGGQSVQELSGGMVPVPLTREQVQALPLILPILVVICGICAAALYKYTWCSSCCASCGLCLSFPFAAFLFLMSALMFPVLLGMTDVCLGMANVGQQYIMAKGDNACSEFGGTGTLDACSINTVNGTQVVVNVPASYMNVFGDDCSTDAIAPMWVDFADSIQRYPTNTVNDFIDEQKKSNSDLTIKPALEAPLRNAASITGNLIGTFVREIGSETLSCSNLGKMWKGVVSPVCCGVGTALYWTIGCIYLLAFSLVCCGIPALLRGRKRFPSKAWGPYYTDSDPKYRGYDPALSQIPGVQVTAANIEMGEAQIAGEESQHNPIALPLDPSEGDQFHTDGAAGPFVTEAPDGSGSIYPPEHNPYAFADPATIPPSHRTSRVSRSGRSQAGSTTPQGAIELSHLPSNASVYHQGGGSRVMHYGGAESGPGFAALDVPAGSSDPPSSGGLEIASPSLYPDMQQSQQNSATPPPVVQGQPLPPGWNTQEI